MASVGTPLIIPPCISTLGGISRPSSWAAPVSCEMIVAAFLDSDISEFIMLQMSTPLAHCLEGTLSCCSGPHFGGSLELLLFQRGIICPMPDRMHITNGMLASHKLCFRAMTRLRTESAIKLPFRFTDVEWSRRCRCGVLSWSWARVKKCPLWTFEGFVRVPVVGGFSCCVLGAIRDRE